MIKKVFKLMKIVEREKEELNKEYEILRDKNSKRSTEIKKCIEQKSKEFASRKASRDKQFDIIRNK